MSLPFDTTFYDTLYASVADVLKVEYPQKKSETIQDWYKRLLYEFMSYVQTQYEPFSVDNKVKPSKKSNRKRKNPKKKYNIVNNSLFSTNVENALEVVSQDSNFAIYLFGWWLPLLMDPTDWICLCLRFDCSDTPASSIKLKSFEVKIDKMLSQVTFIGINGILFNTMTKSQFEKFNTDPFIKSIFKSIYHLVHNTLDGDYISLRNANILNMNISDFQTNSFRIASFLYNLKNITQQLFMSELNLKSNLISENNHELKLTKSKIEKSQRKRFNARKLLKESEVGNAEMSSGIIQTLCVQAFRTFYDFDKSTISKDLFDYMFNKNPLVL